MAGRNESIDRSCSDYNCLASKWKSTKKKTTILMSRANFDFVICSRVYFRTSYRIWESIGSLITLDWDWEKFDEYSGRWLAGWDDWEMKFSSIFSMYSDLWVTFTSHPRYERSEPRSLSVSLTITNDLRCQKSKLIHKHSLEKSKAKWRNPSSSPHNFHPRQCIHIVVKQI